MTSANTVTRANPFRRSVRRMSRAAEHGLALRRWRSAKGLSRVEAVDEINKLGVPLSYSHLNKIEGGSRPLEKASLQLREALRNLYGISREEWIEVIGLHVPVPGPTAPQQFRPSSQYVEVPLTRRVEVYPAGTGPAWDLEEALEPLWLPADLFPGKAMIGLRAMSASMVPYLPEGAIAVIVHDDGLVTPGDYVGVRMADDGVVVKRFVRELGDGELLLESLNPGKDEERLFTAPLGSRIIGPVVRRVLDGRD